MSIQTVVVTVTPLPPPGVSYRVAFREWFGIGPAPAELLVALYCARGEFLTGLQLARTAGVADGAVQRHICDLRSALETEAIDSARLMGYRLTEEGIAECRAALWTMGEELRKAS